MCYHLIVHLQSHPVVPKEKKLQDFCSSIIVDGEARSPSAFDVLESTGEAQPGIIAGGLKVALLSPLFGLLTFSLSKLAILILRIIQK